MTKHGCFGAYLLLGDRFDRWRRGTASVRHRHQPGITGSISGVVTGDIYVTPRQWEEFEATVPSLDATLNLDCRWSQDFNLVGYDGSALLTSSAAVSSDQALHFTQAHRLADDQAVGDDAAICQAVRALAPTLTPEAATPDALRMTF